MFPFNLPHQDWVYISDKTIEAVFNFHRSGQPLDFRNMSESEIDDYMEAWLAALPTTALEDFYNEAMCDNPFIYDHIMQVFHNPDEKSETEITLLRRKFQRPSNDAKKPYSWADEVTDAVNEVIERDSVTSQMDWQDKAHHYPNQVSR